MLRSQRDRFRLSATLRRQGGVSIPVSGLAAHGAVDTKTLLAKKQQQQLRAQTGSSDISWSVLTAEIVKNCSKQDQHKVLHYTVALFMYCTASVWTLLLLRVGLHIELFFLSILLLYSPCILVVFKQIRQYCPL